MVEEPGPVNSAGCDLRPRCPEDNVFLSVIMSSFFAAVLWQYVPAFRSLGRSFLDDLAEGIVDLLSDPESAFVILGFLFSVWIFIKALRLVARLLGATDEN
jgi:hypothetical protein